MIDDPYARKQKWEFRGKAPSGRPYCHSGCGREVPAPRRTSCSEECARAWRQRNDPATIRAVLKDRDRGICAICRTDTALRKRDLRETEGLWKWLARREAERLFEAGQLLDYDGRVAYAWGQVSSWVEREVAKQLKEAGVYAELHSLHSWEADHIVPVVEGGGGCGPEGYRTLCLPCHRRETAALAARRAAQRRKTRQPELQL